MDRGARWTTVHGVAESQRVTHTRDTGEGHTYKSLGHKAEKHSCTNETNSFYKGARANQWCKDSFNKSINSLSPQKQNLDLSSISYTNITSELDMDLSVNCKSIKSSCCDRNQIYVALEANQMFFNG